MEKEGNDKVTVAEARRILESDAKEQDEKFRRDLDDFCQKRGYRLTAEVYMSEDGYFPFVKIKRRA